MNHRTSLLLLILLSVCIATASTAEDRLVTSTDMQSVIDSLSAWKLPMPDGNRAFYANTEKALKYISFFLAGQYDDKLIPPASRMMKIISFFQGDLYGDTLIPPASMVMNMASHGATR